MCDSHLTETLFLKGVGCICKEKRDWKENAAWHCYLYNVELLMCQTGLFCFHKDVGLKVSTNNTKSSVFKRGRK